MMAAESSGIEDILRSNLPHEHQRAASTCYLFESIEDRTSKLCCSTPRTGSTIELD